MATAAQYDAAIKAFNDFAVANKKYMDAHAAADHWYHPQSIKDVWGKAESLVREGKAGWRAEVEKLGLGVEHMASVNAYAESQKAAATLRSAMKAVGEKQEFIDYVASESQGINKANEKGRPVGATDIEIKSGNKDTNLGDAYAAARARAAQQEKEAAARAAAAAQAPAPAADPMDALRERLADKLGAAPTTAAPAPAPTPAPAADADAKAAGIEKLKATIDLVSKGAIIKIDGTSPKHEPARVEVANALEAYFISLEGYKKAAAYKALGLKEGENIVNRLTSEDLQKVVDRKLLGKALRLYQENIGLVADGKVGPATLEQLLARNGVDSGINTAYVVGGVSQSRTPDENEPGHLGGKRNPYSLREYVDGAEADPKKDTANKSARHAMLEAEKVFVKLQFAMSSADGQFKKIAEGSASKVYTQKEHDILKALFEAKGDKAAPIDTSDPISADQVKAFQKAFGLKADGVIGTETARALTQINLRLATDQVIDPSEIRAAVVANAKPVVKAETQK